MAFAPEVAVSGLECGLGFAAFGVGPAHGDVGGAGGAESDVDESVVLQAVVAVAALDFVGLEGAVVGGGQAGADGGAVGGGAFEENLDGVAVLGGEVFEEADVSGAGFEAMGT